MNRFGRWLLYALRLRPTYWRVDITRVGPGVYDEDRRVWGRRWATAEDVAAANAEAWADTCRRLGGRRNVRVLGCRRVG